MTTQDYNDLLRNRVGAYTPTFTAFTMDSKRSQNDSQHSRDPILDSRTNDFGVYLQDQYRVSASLTRSLDMDPACSVVNGVITPSPRLREGSAAGGFPDGTNARRVQAALRLIW